MPMDKFESLENVTSRFGYRGPLGLLSAGFRLGLAILSIALLALPVYAAE